MTIRLTPIATIRNSRLSPIDDGWDTIPSQIVLAEDLPEEAFAGIEAFSHLEVIFYFDQVQKHDVVIAGRPRGNPNYPLMGIFAQRKKDRPNAIGLSTVELLEHNGRSLTVRNLDAMDGTPVLDIKPVFKEFEPQGAIRQPDWVSTLMTNYWSKL